MTTIQFELPEDLRAFVEEQTAAGGYASASDYVYALLLETERRQARANVERLILEGINSGPRIEATPEYWEAKLRKFGQPAQQESEPCPGESR